MIFFVVSVRVSVGERRVSAREIPSLRRYRHITSGGTPVYFVRRGPVHLGNPSGGSDWVMVVTATEFKTNFGKYLELIAKEDVFITRNGKTVAKVVNPHVSAVDSLRGMLGGISSDIDIDSLREERLLKYEDHV